MLSPAPGCFRPDLKKQLGGSCYKPGVVGGGMFQFILTVVHELLKLGVGQCTNCIYLSVLFNRIATNGVHGAALFPYSIYKQKIPPGPG